MPPTPVDGAEPVWGIKRCRRQGISSNFEFWEADAGRISIDPPIGLRGRFPDPCYPTDVQVRPTVATIGKYHTHGTEGGMDSAPLQRRRVHELTVGETEKVVDQELACIWS